MRRRQAVILVVVALLATGFYFARSTSARTTAVKRPVLAFTCCSRRDVSRVYHPGDVIDLHWTRVTTYSTAPAGPVSMTLRAALDGWFPSVEDAKAAGATGADRVVARPVQVTGQTGTAPVSRLPVPKDASPGLYDITFTIDYGGGTSESGESTIRIGKPVSAGDGASATGHGRSATIQA